jgi:3-phenylpropionate/trans-cinnamate dioxygenase ferredoxin reductase component
VTSQPSNFVGAALRFESWANAQSQAIVAAKAALGRADRYDEIPWFWSDQYTANLRMLGLPDRGSKIVTRGAPEAGNGCWLMLREDGTAAGAVAARFRPHTCCLRWPIARARRSTEPPRASTEATTP